MGPESVWTFRETEKPLAPAGIRAPYLPGRSLGVMPTTLSRLPRTLQKYTNSQFVSVFTVVAIISRSESRYSPVGCRFRVPPSPAAERRMLRQRHGGVRRLRSASLF